MDLDLLLYKRAPRSTVLQRTELEQHQDAVIASLIASGDRRIADRLRRCQAQRATRSATEWPWRCDSQGCWQCQRAATRRHWRGFVNFVGKDASLIYVPGIEDPFESARHLRKSLRDMRDRQARRDHVWSEVALAGMVDVNRALVLAKHTGLERGEVWDVLESRWPDATMHDIDAYVPDTLPTIEIAAELSRRRRSIEPIRIVVARQREPSWDDDEIEVIDGTAPMPMCW